MDSHDHIHHHLGLGPDDVHGAENDHVHHHEHHGGHGHEHDQGIQAMLRYLRHAPQMWSSEVNTAVVERIAPQPGETVMDIGAGIGAGTMVAAKTGCTIEAVEPTPYMRAVLGVRRLLTRTKNRVRIVDGTAEATTLPSDSVHAAWAVNTMHHWTSLEQGVAELVRVLAPGGRMLLVDEDFDNPEHPDYESFGAARSEEHEHNFHSVDPEVVSDALTAAGANVVFAGMDQIAGSPAVVIEATV